MTGAMVLQDFKRYIYIIEKNQSHSNNYKEFLLSKLKI